LEKLYNPNQIAEILGVKTSTVNRFIKNGLPIFAINRKCRRIRESDLTRWLQKHRVSSKQDIYVNKNEPKEAEK
jgi:excisionase family DNA binding protein